MMFSKTLSTELIGDNIRVDCVNPGLILTPDWIKTAKQLTAGKGGDWQAYLDSVAREHAPIKRFATPAGTGELLRLPLLGARKLLRRINLLRRRRNVEVGLSRYRHAAGERDSVLRLRQFIGLRLGSRRFREADMVGDADHARDAFRVRLGAASLIGQVNQSGNRHPAVLDIDV